MKLKVLRVTKRARAAVNDIDYAGSLSETEREWMEVFISAYYSNDFDSQVALTGSKRKAKQWQREVNATNYEVRSDITASGTRIPLPEDEDNPLYLHLFETDSKNFQYYRCTRCLKAAAVCRCPVKRPQPYGIDDYSVVSQCPETAFAEAEAALNERAYDMQPYGTAPEGLKPGHKVIICLPHHYLKDRSGTVVEYRRLTDEYLVQADRPGLRHRDGTQAPTTLCWVRPEGLKRAKLSRVEN